MVDGTTAAMTPTAITRAQPSPELETQISGIVGRLNTLSEGYREQYQAKQDTYQDVIRSLYNVYGAQAGAGAGAARSSALASGLTPLEATQQGQQSLQGTLQQLFPQVAGLRTEQADVGIQLQEALQGVTGQEQDLLSGVVSPYLRSLAGTEEYDILGREQLTEQTRQFTTEQGRLENEFAVEQQRMARELQSEEQRFAEELSLRQQEIVIAHQDRMAQLRNAISVARIAESGATARAQASERGATTRYEGQMGMRERELTAARDQAQSMAILNSIIGREARTETETFTGGESALDRAAAQRRTETTAGGRTARLTPAQQMTRDASNRVLQGLITGGDYRLVPSPTEGVGNQFRNFVSPAPGVFFAEEASNVWGPGRERGSDETPTVTRLYELGGGGGGTLVPHTPNESEVLPPPGGGTYSFGAGANPTSGSNAERDAVVNALL